MKEYRKIFDLPPLKLTRADIRSLADLVGNSIPVTRDKGIIQPLNFSIGTDNTTYTAHSIDDLLANTLPDTIDAFSIRGTGWSDYRTINCGISINLRRTVADVQIHAIDGIWFKGMIQEINEFCINHSPWYRIFRNCIAFISGGLNSIFCCAFLFFLYREQFLFSMISLLTVIAKRLIPLFPARSTFCR